MILVMFLCMSFPACTLFGNIKGFFTDRFSIEDDVDEVTEIVDSFFGLLIDKNYQGAYEYLSSKDKSQKDLECFKQEFTNITDIISININWVEIKNNTAIAGIDLTDSYDGEEKLFRNIEVSLIREEDRSWKIVFWNQKDE